MSSLVAETLRKEGQPLQALSPMERLRRETSAEHALLEQATRLLICHHCSPRFVSYDVRAACDFLSQTLSWLITVGERADRLQQRARVDDRLRGLIQHLSEADDLATGLALGSGDLLAIVDATGAALVHAGKTTTFGLTPPLQIIEAVVRWLRSREERGVFSTERLRSASSPRTRAAGPRLSR